jgi:hypothetical protein
MRCTVCDDTAWVRAKSVRYKAQTASAYRTVAWEFPTRTKRQSAIRGAGRAALAFCVACLMAPTLLRADEDTLAAGRAEMQKAIISLRPRPSLDTYPIDFNVGPISYRIPRNYLTTMDNWSGGPQGLVTVTVNLRDLKPLSEENQACFTVKAPDRPPGCEPFSFRINGTGGPSAEKAFANMSQSFHSQAPIAGPFGFEKYEIGPENAGLEYYRKTLSDRTLVYSCMIFDNRGKRDGLCDPVSDRASSGAVIHFFFNLKHLPEIEVIDEKLRKLVDSFTIQSGDGK